MCIPRLDFVPGRSRDNKRQDGDVEMHLGGRAQGFRIFPQYKGRDGTTFHMRSMFRIASNIE